MQLGIQKTSVPGALPGGLAEEARWGGDLIDVNADADDWSTCLNLSSLYNHQFVLYSPADEFESAPAESGGTNAVGVGWHGASYDEDPWAAFEDPAPPRVPISVTELTSPPVPATPSASVVTPARTLSAQAARPSRVAALSPSPSPRRTPLASPATSECATSPVVSPASAPSTVGMTKEEKAAEMARRKEERKQVGSRFLRWLAAIDDC
jgi:SCY1-like protein 1